MITTAAARAPCKLAGLGIVTHRLEDSCSSRSRVQVTATTLRRHCKRLLASRCSAACRCHAVPDAAVYRDKALAVGAMPVLLRLLRDLRSLVDLQLMQVRA